MIDLSQLEKTKTEADIQQELALAEAKHYLSTTDWYVLRFVETAKPVPDEIKTLRDAARKIVEEAPNAAS